MDFSCNFLKFFKKVLIMPRWCAYGSNRFREKFSHFIKDNEIIFTKEFYDKNIASFYPSKKKIINISIDSDSSDNYHQSTQMSSIASLINLNYQSSELNTYLDGDIPSNQELLTNLLTPPNSNE